MGEVNLCPSCGALPCDQTASPIPSRGTVTRDQIARLIDPWAHGIVANISHTERAAKDRDRALAKADAILALFPVEAGDVGWRPIETAPRDGTEFQAWWRGQWQPRARFDAEYGSFQLWGRTDFDTEGWEAFAIEGHWQPLPSPPLAEGQDHE